MARTRAADYDTKRQNILDKSAVLFAQFGFAGTSNAMIAKACGASKALLYHYYPDKEALLFDVIAYHLDELIEAVEAALDGAPAGDRIYVVAAALLEAYRDADSKHQIQIASRKLLPPEKQDLLRAKERRLVAFMSDAIVDALPALRDGKLLKPVTMSAFGMLNWHYLWFRDGMGVSRADYARLVSDMIVAGAERALATSAAAGPADQASPASSDPAKGRRKAGERVAARPRTARAPAARMVRTPT